MIACVANSSGEEPRSGQTRLGGAALGQHWGALVSFKCSSGEKRNPICQTRSPVANGPLRTCVHKNSAEKKSTQKQKLATAAAPPAPPPAAAVAPPGAAAVESERVEKRVENKNFYLNGKNQQMQRKTI